MDGRTERFLRMRDVIDRVGLKKGAIRNRVQAGTFPRPLQVSSRASMWREKDIDKWMLQQIEAAKQGEEGDD